MNAKRKFVVGSASEEDTDELHGFNLFKKYKSSAAGASGSTSGDSTTTNQKIKSNNTPEAMKMKQDNPSAQPASASPSPMKKPEKPKIGRTFAETFAYLKDTDLYKLPPEKKEPPKPTIQRNTNAIIVNSRQRGNPILKHVRNVPYEFGEIIPDYEIGQTSCALFLSLRYHNLNPDYIHDRLKQLGSRYTLRVLLVQVDLVNTKHSLKELAKICLLAGMTLILAWSPEEAGRYLETYKSYEFKPPDVLQEKVEADHLSKMQDVLTTIKSVNKTDVITLMSTFGSFRNIVNAEKEELALCPGIGPQKAQRLHKVFNESFRRSTSETLKRDNTEISPSKRITKTSNDETTVDAKDNVKTSILKPAELLGQLLPEAPMPDTQAKEVKKKSKTKTKEDVRVDKSPEKTFVIHPKKSPSQSSRPALSKTAAITQSALSRTRKSKTSSTKTLIDTSPNCNDQSTFEKQKDKIHAPKNSSTILSSPGKNASDSITESALSGTRKPKASSTKTLVSRSPKRNETMDSENQNIEINAPKFSLTTSGSSGTKTADLDIVQTKRLQKINSETTSADVRDSRKSSPNINRTELSTLVPMPHDIIPAGGRKKSQGTTEISQEDYDGLLASDEDSEDSS